MLNKDNPELFASLFETYPLSILIISSDFIIEKVNPCFKSYFGLTKNIKQLSELFSVEETNIINGLMSEVLEGKNAISKDVTLLNAISEECLIHIELFSFDFENATKLVVSFRDVSERRHQQEIQTYRELLDKVNVELDQFVYKTAHDLRAPLTNLIGLIGLMRNEKDLNVLNTYFDLQETSVNKMDDFIQKITAYTKNARLPVVVSEINFNHIIDRILSELMFYDKSEFVQKSVNINIKTAFYSDSERIETVLRNLLANSIKFSNQNAEMSTITVEITEENDNCIIVLRDNGIGIPDNIQSRVFDMFYRGHGSADGSGLGLYIVKETLVKLGGSINLHSKEKLFTEITLTLPSLLSK